MTTNATALIVAPEPRNFVGTVANQVGAGAAIGVAAGAWLYNKLLTEPLRIFYFVGPIWGNLPPSEVCSRLTSVPGKQWESTPDLTQACLTLLDQKFTSFDASIMTTLYFAFLTFVVCQLVCGCCFIRPIIRELRGNR
jgi:hypothetical protein